MVTATSQFLIYFVGIIGTTALVVSTYIFLKLRKGAIRKVVSGILAAMFAFSFAGFLYSLREFGILTHIYGIDLIYVEYSIYAIVYIIASIKLRSITNIFGFVVQK